jgi:hypothetical protein
MSISANKIMKPLIEGNCMSFENMKKQIFDLRRRLRNPEKQTLYFRKGIKSVRARYNRLLANYEYIKNLINSNDLSYFEEKIFEKKKLLNRINVNSTFSFMAHQSVLNSIREYKDFLAIKKKYGKLKGIFEAEADGE